MIEHCRDFRRVKRIFDHNIYIASDGYYLMEVQEGKDLGVCFFHPHKDGLMMHVNYTEGCRGKDAAQSMKNAFKWIFNNTSCNVIYADIPAGKKNVHMFACGIGFEFDLCENDNRCYILKRFDIDMKMAV